MQYSSKRVFRVMVFQRTRYSSLRNKFSITGVLLLCCTLASGCLIADKQTVEMSLISPQRGRVTYIYHGIKSDSNEEDEIKKDFDELTAMVSEESRAQASENDKIKIERWNIDVDENDLVYGAVEATFNVPEFFAYNDYKISNEEIIIVLPIVNNQKLTSNGKIVKTKNNYVLVWPKDSKNLEWTIVDKDSMKYPSNLNKFFIQ